MVAFVMGEQEGAGRTHHRERKRCVNRHKGGMTVGPFIGAILGAVVGIFIITTIIAAFFMWIGAKLAKVEKATFGKAILAALAAAAITWVLFLLFNFIPVVGPMLGLIIGLILTIFAIKAIFSTTFGKAALVWLFNIIAVIIAGAIGAATFGAALWRAVGSMPPPM
jgi:hypothetical protein